VLVQTLREACQQLVIVPSITTLHSAKYLVSIGRQTIHTHQNPRKLKPSSQRRTSAPMLMPPRQLRCKPVPPQGLGELHRLPAPFESQSSSLYPRSCPKRTTRMDKCPCSQAPKHYQPWTLHIRQCYYRGAQPFKNRICHARRPDCHYRDLHYKYRIFPHRRNSAWHRCVHSRQCR